MYDAKIMLLYWNLQNTTTTDIRTWRELEDVFAKMQKIQCVCNFETVST